MVKISVLFVRARSPYKTEKIDGVQLDPWDAKRNALNFDGDNPVIAHPPCRLWSKLKHLSTAEKSEKELARFAVKVVQCNGGVLEHPAESSLWDDMNLPKPGSVDKFGGWTWEITQSLFGHRARKLTWLYFVGVDPESLPPIKPVVSDSRVEVMQMGTAERERTPVSLVRYLVSVLEPLGRPQQETNASCDSCGAPFLRSTLKSRFCSNACRQKAYRQRAANGNVTRYDPNQLGLFDD